MGSFGEEGIKEILLEIAYYYQSVEKLGKGIELLSYIK